MSLPLILLKTANQPSDPYDTHFTTHPLPSNGSFTPIFVPVLHHRHVNLPTLTSLITASQISFQTPTAPYECLIITSQRAVEALGKVLSDLDSASAPVQEFLSKTTVFVVGPATAKAIAELGFRDENIHGRECGNGAALAEVIVGFYNDADSGSAARRKILFLVGETRRDIIPRRLAGAEIPLEEMVVYETAVVEDFRDAFRGVVESTAGAERRWVVVFSPQGADVALEVLREEEGRSLVATIGPTTEGHLVEKLGRRPDVVAGKPTPEGLWEAIRAWIEREEEA